MTGSHGIITHTGYFLILMRNSLSFTTKGPRDIYIRVQIVHA